MLVLDLDGGRAEVVLAQLVPAGGVGQGGGPPELLLLAGLDEDLGPVLGDDLEVQLGVEVG
jgi:hypothetical protein